MCAIFVKCHGARHGTNACNDRHTSNLCPSPCCSTLTLLVQVSKDSRHVLSLMTNSQRCKEWQFCSSTGIKPSDWIGLLPESLRSLCDQVYAFTGPDSVLHWRLDSHYYACILQVRHAFPVSPYCTCLRTHVAARRPYIGGPQGLLGLGQAAAEPATFLRGLNHSLPQIRIACAVAPHVSCLFLLSLPASHLLCVQGAVL